MNSLLRWACCGLLLFLGSGNLSAREKLKVLTSFLPLYSFTAQVAGDLAQVDNLLPPNASPHDYQFSPRDLRKLSRADLIVVSGAGLEGWLQRAFRTTGGDKRPSLKAAAGLESLLIKNQTEVVEGHDAAHHAHPGGFDPHYWLDPRLAALAVSNIVTGLSQADPVNAPGYARNGSNYIERLKRLDAEFTEGLKDVTHRKIVSYHNAFPYLANRYGLTVVGVVEEIPDVSPSPRYLSTLSRAIRDNGVRVLFTEAGEPPKLARQIARDLGLQVAPLDTLESGPLSPTAYEEGMRRNLETLRRTLK